MPLYSSPIRTADGRLLPTRGDLVCDWIEENLVYGEGDWFGEPVQLRDFQRRWIYRLYEFYPETGARRYKIAVKGVGKGNGKTPEAGWIGAAELGGPVAPVSPHVLTGAASLRQANLVFRDMKDSIAKGRLGRFFEPYDLQLLVKGSAGLAERIAAEAGTNDGARCTAFLADELHEWTGRTARVFMVVRGAVAKRRNAFTLAISTAGARNEDSPLRELYEHGKRVASGEVVDDSFLFEWYEAPEGLDLDDEEQWLQAVQAANPAAGDFLDVENLRHRFRTMPRFEFERYHLNRWTAVAARWLPPGAWEACQAEVAVPDEASVYLGFKGNYSGTKATLWGCWQGHLFEVGNWERDDPEWLVPRGAVDAAITEAFERFDVRQFVFDPSGWPSESEAWQDIWGQTVAVRYNVAKRKQWVEACDRFYTAVMQHSLTHDGSPVLTRHMEEAEVRESGDGTYITGALGAQAAVMAYEAMAQNEGDEPGVQFAGDLTEAEEAQIEAETAAILRALEGDDREDG